MNETRNQRAFARGQPAVYFSDHEELLEKVIIGCHSERGRRSIASQGFEAISTGNFRHEDRLNPYSMLSNRIRINAFIGECLSARRGELIYTRNLLSSLAERGLDITIAVPNEFADDEMDNVRTFNIIRFSHNRFAWEQIYWRKFVRDHGPDVYFLTNFGLLNSPVKQILLLREGGLSIRSIWPT